MIEHKNKRRTTNGVEFQNLRDTTSCSTLPNVIEHQNKRNRTNGVESENPCDTSTCTGSDENAILNKTKKKTDYMRQ